jgi:hypothetical protein
MTDNEFYSKISDLAEEAELSGLTRTSIIESLRLLADSLEEEDRDR